jgi:hypothetical protein
MERIPVYLGGHGGAVIAPLVEVIPGETHMLGRYLSLDGGPVLGRIGGVLGVLGGVTSRQRHPIPVMDMLDAPGGSPIYGGRTFWLTSQLAHLADGLLRLFGADVIVGVGIDIVGHHPPMQQVM